MIDTVDEALLTEADVVAAARRATVSGDLSSNRLLRTCLVDIVLVCYKENKNGCGRD